MNVFGHATIVTGSASGKGHQAAQALAGAGEVPALCFVGRTGPMPPGELGRVIDINLG